MQSCMTEHCTNLLWIRTVALSSWSNILWITGTVRKWLITSVDSVKYCYTAVLVTHVYTDTGWNNGVNFRFEFLWYFWAQHEDLSLNQCLCSLSTERLVLLVVLLVSQCLCYVNDPRRPAGEFVSHAADSCGSKNRCLLLVSFSLWVTFDQFQGFYVTNPNAGHL